MFRASPLMKMGGCLGWGTGGDGILHAVSTCLTSLPILCQLAIHSYLILLILLSLPELQLCQNGDYCIVWGREVIT